LALPQLEGLFSEMCRVINPDADMSQHSLTIKVNTMRPYHSLSDAYFDYYQYHIPQLRNKFAHTGYDADFKLKSYDLLADLLHLLKIFYELDDPLVKINRIHIKKDPHHFISISDYAEYFELIGLLKQSQKKEIGPAIEAFEKEYLVRECSIDYTVGQFYQQGPQLTEEMIAWMDDNLKYYKIPVELKKMHLPEIIKVLAEPAYLDRAHTVLISKTYEFEKLYHYYVFLKAYKSRLPSLDKTAKTLLDDLYKEYLKLIEKLIKVRSFILDTYENSL
jgi:hypothetical protein